MKRSLRVNLNGSETGKLLGSLLFSLLEYLALLRGALGPL